MDFVFDACSSFFSNMIELTFGVSESLPWHDLWYDVLAIRKISCIVGTTIPGTGMSLLSQRVQQSNHEMCLVVGEGSDWISSKGRSSFDPEHGTFAYGTAVQWKHVIYNISVSL
jgi:hypothetical protein